MSDTIKMRALRSVPPLLGVGDAVLRKGAARGKEFTAMSAEDARLLVASGWAEKVEAATASDKAGK